MLRSRVCIGGAVALLVIVGTACGGDDDDDSNASAVTTTSTTTAGSDSGSSEEFDAYVGLTVEAATAKAEDEGRPACVVEEDGESLPVTMDFNPDRLNFTVVDGKVTEVSTG